MLRWLIGVVVALAAGAACAEAAEGLGSAKCREALASLQVRELALAASASARVSAEVRAVPAPDARLQALRKLAARACLGGRDDAPLRTQGYSAPAISVPPVVVAPPVAPPPRTPPPASKAVEPPTLITACDALGCWASDGTRLHRVGPNLQGPRGLCSVQGGVLHCP